MNGRDEHYEANNIAFDWQYTEADGGGIKCKNYEICEEVLPRWWFECKENYLCTNCDMLFGTWTNKVDNVYRTGKGILNISENEECVICLEVKRCTDQPNCEHKICIQCFKRCHYGDLENEPQFPYPEIEDEYYDDQDNPKWKTEYPLIESYNLEFNEWDDKREMKYEQEEYLRKCPICRK